MQVRDIHLENNQKILYDSRFTKISLMFYFSALSKEYINTPVQIARAETNAVKIASIAYGPPFVELNC